MHAQKKFRQKAAAFVKRYTLHWYILTMVLYAAAIPLTIWVFPATTLILTVVILFSGFTASVASLASVITDAEQDEKIERLQD